jgi:hypothetical protein
MENSKIKSGNFVYRVSNLEYTDLPQLDYLKIETVEEFQPEPDGPIGFMLKYEGRNFLDVVWPNKKGDGSIIKLSDEVIFTEKEDCLNFCESLVAKWKGTLDILSGHFNGSLVYETKNYMDSKILVTTQMTRPAGRKGERIHKIVFENAVTEGAILNDTELDNLISKLQNYRDGLKTL